MKWIVIIISIFISEICIGQDSAEVRKKWEVNGYLKSLASLTFDKYFENLISGNLIHNRLNIKWKPSDQITVVSEFRNRLFWGEEVKSNPDFAEQLRNGNELVNLQKVWIEKEALVLHTNVERLYFDFREDKINVRVGRQRINWGITSTWNPNDLFNTYNFLDFDYEERPGSDAAWFKYNFSNSFKTEIAYAYTDDKKGNVAALKYSLNKWNYDMQLITGWYNDHPTLGVGWAGYLKDAGFKGESQYFFRAGDSADHFNMSLESDYMFKKGWYVSVGMLFNSRGLSDPVNNWDTVSLKLSPENLMPTKWNFMVSTSKEITPLFIINMGVLYAPGTNLLILLPSFQYNIATNLDVNLVWQSFFAESYNEFEAANHRCYLRLKWNF